MFKELYGVKEARRLLLEICRPLERLETIPLSEGAGRVLALDITSKVNVPSFNRAAMDGFAVSAAETMGASPNNPISLTNPVPLRTGAAIPEGTDAVLMREDAIVRTKIVEITAQVHPGRNVAIIGEDVAAGDQVLLKGHRLRPPDIALLAALSISKLDVYERPKVAIIPTGSELVPIDTKTDLLPGQAREINSIMTSLYVKAWGGEASVSPIVPDDPDTIKEAIQNHTKFDMILLSGGTSVGDKDFAPYCISELGDLLVHGLRMTPGKPTAVGHVRDVPVICLPGYPVAALAALYQLVRPALLKMAHLPDIQKTVVATLSEKIVSRPGYFTVARVKLHDGFAEPIMTSGAGILSSVTRSDGLVLVPEEIEGVEIGEKVEVILLE